MGDCTVNIDYSSSLDDLCSINSSFDKGILRVCYHGKNRNKTCITKETFEENISTIFNIPVVCNYMREDEQIGGHDVDIVKTKDNKLRLINKTEPIGVVPTGASWWWEFIDDENDGHEYLCTEVILWKRQEAYKYIKNKGTIGESMEINIKSGHMDDDGYFIIDRFEFSAFCLLETEIPCYENARLEVFSKHDFAQQYKQMLHEFKESFGNTQYSIRETEHVINNNLKGGANKMDEKLKLLSEFGLELDQLDFSLDDYELDTLRQKFESLSADKGGDPIPSNYSLTSEQYRSELIKALNECEVIKGEYGEYPRYSYIDYLEEKSEVYCWVTKLLQNICKNIEIFI